MALCNFLVSVFLLNNTKIEILKHLIVTEKKKKACGFRHPLMHSKLSGTDPHFVVSGMYNWWARVFSVSGSRMSISM